MSKLSALKDYINWDRVGISLSSLCAIHCAIMPFLFLFLPLAQHSETGGHFPFHLLMLIFVLPVGLLAFLSGYRHHHLKLPLLIGVPGLLIVSVVPFIFHHGFHENLEYPMMMFGSSILIFAHLRNRKACRCQVHHHGHKPHGAS